MEGNDRGLICYGLPFRHLTGRAEEIHDIKLPPSVLPHNSSTVLLAVHTRDNNSNNCSSNQIFPHVCMHDSPPSLLASGVARGLVRAYYDQCSPLRVGSSYILATVLVWVFPQYGYSTHIQAYQQL